MADLVINPGLIAGGANLLNLFDLRPGRAIKVTLAAGTALGAASPAARTAVAAPLGAALGLLPEDLGERAMLGDCRRQRARWHAGPPRPRRRCRARPGSRCWPRSSGLTAASEVVSFTKVIERTPPLRWLDMLGRRPAAAAARTGRPGQARPARGTRKADLPRWLRPATGDPARGAGVGRHRSRAVTGPAAPVTEQRAGAGPPAAARQEHRRAAVLIGVLTAPAG